MAASGRQPHSVRDHMHRDGGETGGGPTGDMRRPGGDGDRPGGDGDRPLECLGRHTNVT